MKAAIGLLLMLVRVSLGVETFCDGRQNKAQCYGALGGTVVIQLMDNVLENQRFTWSDPNHRTVRWRSNRPVISNVNNTSEIISNNKAVRVKNLSRTDDGEYRFEIHEDGVRTSLRTLQLNIQAPVSSVQVKSECLSQGEKRMSCSSEGDSPQFSWTLNGDTLTDDQLLSGSNKINEITLKATVSGELVCTVRNHVSNASATETIPTCGVETFCDGRQNKAQCYGALGGTVVIQLMDNVLENQRFTWSDPKNQTVRWRSNRPVINNANNTSEIISNNTAVRMKNLSRTDDGEYRFEIHVDGVRTSLRTLQLNIQAPVSSVQLKSECLSQGVKRMSCSSEGDSPQFSWTLNGDTLTDDQLLSGNNEINEITLKATVSGELVCTVRNHVSNASATETIPTCGVETFCDGRQNKAQCYGALGGTVVIQLMDNVLENQRFTWSDPNHRTVRWRSNRPVINNFNNRSEIISNNKAVRMKNLSRTDDGEYRFEIHVDGVRTSLRTLQLNIQAPVSSVQVKSECLSQGVKRMSCSSEGDSPQFSWTLDGDTLTDDQLLSGNNETNEITLKATVSGELVCTVRNHVSNASATETIPTCDEVLLTLLLRALVVTIILSGIHIYFTWKTKKKKKYYEITMSSIINHRMEHEHNSVIMVEMRKD